MFSEIPTWLQVPAIIFGVLGGMILSAWARGRFK